MSITHAVVFGKGILLAEIRSATQTSQTSWTFPLEQQTLEIQENGNYEEDEMTNPQYFLVSGATKRASLVPRFVDAAQNKRTLREDPERKAQATLQDGFAKLSVLARVETIPQQL